MRGLALIALTLTTACSKKEPPAASATGSAAAAKPTPTEATPVEAAPAKGPKVTPEMLYATEPVWTVEMVPRGLWMRTGSGPVEHKCRQELANAWVQNSMLRTKSQADAGATTCGPHGAFTVCTYAKPGGNPAAEPKDLAHWVFTGTDAAPIMVAALYGPIDDFDAIAPQLAKIESCPRPSDDPQ